MHQLEVSKGTLSFKKFLNYAKISKSRSFKS